MKCKLPNLTRAAAAILLCCGSSFGQAPAPSGEQLIQRAARNLATEPSLEAKIRQRVTLFDEYLIGTGSYRQLIIGDQKMFRLELALQVDAATSSVLQVCNGDVFWEKRNFGDQEQLGYATVQNIRDAVSRAGGRRFNTAQLAIGGLDQLLTGLSDCFVFGSPVQRQIEDLPVWEIYGHWKREKIASLLPGRPSDREGPIDFAALPGHVPHRIVIWLGRDRPLPLFPYRIEYQRRNYSEADQVTAFEPIVTMELFEVQRYASVTAQHFDFQGSRAGRSVDLTKQILKRLAAPTP